MTSSPGPSVPEGSEDPTVAAPVRGGRVVVVTHNFVAQAIVDIAAVVGRPTVVLDSREGWTSPQEWLRSDDLRDDDAVVVCDHDAPGALDVLRAALRSPAGYVAMVGSRRRAAHVFEMLSGEGFTAELANLRIPAGHDLGGKAAGEIALSVMAEVVATAYSRPGGPMRDRSGGQPG